MQISKLVAVALVGMFFVADVAADSPRGRWRGGWASQTTGHTGPLRARIREVGPDSYRAVFAGRFAKVIPFIYPAKLERVPGTCDCYRSVRRMPLLGTYTMTAHISGGRLLATYHSRRDVGTLDLSR